MVTSLLKVEARLPSRAEPFFQVVVGVDQVAVAVAADDLVAILSVRLYVRACVSMLWAAKLLSLQSLLLLLLPLFLAWSIPILSRTGRKQDQLMSKALC